jgi:type 1 fimbria pilin
MRSFAKSTLIAAVLSTLATSVALADVVGQINFTGEITAATCLINNSKTLTQTVDMGKVSASYVNHTSYKGTSFDLNFTGCSKAPKVTFVNFDSATGVLPLSTGATAQNVGIVLLRNDTQLTSNEITGLALNGDAVKVTLVAKYKHIGSDPIVVGSADAMTQVDVLYE